jgi:hypothetical protein
LSSNNVLSPTQAIPTKREQESQSKQGAVSSKEKTRRKKEKDNHINALARLKLLVNEADADFTTAAASLKLQCWQARGCQRETLEHQGLPAT